MSAQAAPSPLRAVAPRPPGTGPRPADVLCVLLDDPFPPTSGVHLRVVGHLDVLRRLGLRPHVLYFPTAEQAGSPPSDGLREAAATVRRGTPRREQHTFSKPELILHKLDFGLAGLLEVPRRRYPFSMRLDAVGADAQVLEAARAAGAEVVVLPSILAHYAPALNRAGLRVIADAYDVMTELSRSFLVQYAGANPVRKLSLRANYWSCRSQERNYLKQCAEIWATSDREAASIRGLAPGAQVLVVPSTVPVPASAVPAAPPTPGRVGFIATYSFLPNLEAADVFARDIFPLVRARRPEASLHLAGRGLVPADVQRLESSPGVRAIGAVPDSGAFLDGCAVVALPLLVRGGVPLKLIEAMARGRPVVAYRSVTEGLPVEDGRDVRVADDPETFARVVAELLADEDACRRLGEAARRTFQSHWSRDHAADVLARGSLLVGRAA